MNEIVGRRTVNAELKKIWAEIDRLSEEFMRTGRYDLVVTIDGLKAQAIRIMELQKKKEEEEDTFMSKPETEAEYADRKFDEEIEFLSKYGNLEVVELDRD